MSSRAIRRSLRLQCKQRSYPHPFVRHESGSRTSSQNIPTGTPRNRLKWYGLSSVGVSALGIWLWDLHTSRQLALRPLSPDYFTPITLFSSDKINENTKLLRLKVPPEVVERMVVRDFHSIWSIYVKDSDIQVERPYTPLEGLSEEGEMVFWIKKYEHGEVGRWLHARKPGETIEIRGPEPTWAWQDGDWDNIIMVAGGTGIAPFYQLLHSIFATKSPELMKTKFTLLQSYRRPSELPPPLILDSLSSWERDNPQHFKVQTFVDDLDDSPTDGKLMVRRILKDDLKSVLKTTGGRTIVLVCGPDLMINALAGPKARDQSQGPLGGALGALNDGTFHVWKL